MNCLAIECSGSIFSSEIRSDSETLSQYRNDQPMISSKIIASSTQQLLKKSNLTLNEIDYAIYNGGPGSFTGLRVGLSFLKGLFFDSQTQLIRIPSFDGLRLNAQPDSIALFESKRDEVYVYQDSKIVTLKKDSIKEKWSQNQHFISYHIPRSISELESFNVTYIEYDAGRLIDTFAQKTNHYIKASATEELIYVYG